MLKEMRISKGITQEQLANSIGVTQALVSQWETGRVKMTVEMARKIARALGCTWTELFDEKTA